MNNITFFFAYGISNYAGSRWLYYIDVEVFGGKLVKNSFTRCWVPFRDFRCFHVRLYIPSVRRCLKSPRFVLYLHTILFVARHVIESLLHKWEETSLNISGKEVDLARNLFHKQPIRHQKSINIQQSFRLGRRATLYRERLIKKEDFKRRYSRDRRRSFSISLVFIRQFWNRVRKRDSCST